MARNPVSEVLTRGLLVAAACACVAAAPLVAQDAAPPPPPPSSQMQGPPPGGPGHRGGMNPEHRLRAMKEQLGLTDDQARKVKAILDESHGKQEGIRADTSLSLEDRRARNGAIMREENERVRAVLTPDQLPRYDEMREHMRKGRRPGPGEGANEPLQPPPPPPPAASSPQQ